MTYPNLQQEILQLFAEADAWRPVHLDRPPQTHRSQRLGFNPQVGIARKGAAGSLAALRPQDVRDIRSGRLGVKAFARLYGITPKAVRNCRDRITYRSF